MKQKISVIIPAYNKEPVIFRNLISVYNNLSNLTDNFEIITVNDGSTDNTLFEIKRFKDFKSNDKIQIHNYSENIGKGHALKYGFNNSTGNIVVFFDADLDIDCSKITESINLLIKNNADIVIGSKYHYKSRISYPFIRIFCSKILQIIVSVLFNLNVSDTQVGLKTFRREVLNEVMPKLIVKKFAIDLEILVVASMYKFNKIIEVPIVLNHNKIGSTIGLKAVKDFLQDTLAIFYRKNILKFYNSKTVNQSNLLLQTTFLQQQHK